MRYAPRTTALSQRKGDRHEELARVQALSNKFQGAKANIGLDLESLVVLTAFWRSRQNHSGTESADETEG